VRATSAALEAYQISFGPHRPTAYGPSFRTNYIHAAQHQWECYTGLPFHCSRQRELSLSNARGQRINIRFYLEITQWGVQVRSRPQVAGVIYGTTFYGGCDCLDIRLVRMS
jgi:hypothetical protein